MKITDFCRRQLGCSTESELFDYLCKSLVDSITVWDYFVNWKKVEEHTRSLERDLNLLNVLIGKHDIKQELKLLLKDHPTIAALFPLLLACRETDFRILTDFTDGQATHAAYSFQERYDLTEAQINNICEFAEQSGLLRIFSDRKITSVPSYVFGVEVGLDSNARKNRSGTQMEDLVKPFVAAAAAKHDFKWMDQATPQKMKKHWGVAVGWGEAREKKRKFDFAFKRNNALCLVETNYYHGGGTKLSATAGEFENLHRALASAGHTFVWITDGRGWLDDPDPFREACRNIDHVLNLRMVAKGGLEAILTDIS